MKKVTRYRCSYCKKERAKPETIERHELECISNPNGKNCYKCHYAVNGGYRQDFNGSDHWVDDLPYCMMYDSPLDELRYGGVTALNCSDYKTSGRYYEREQNRDGTVRTAFGDVIDLFGDETDENEAN